MFRSTLLMECPLPEKKKFSFNSGHPHLNLQKELESFENSGASCVMFIWDKFYKNQNSALRSLYQSVRLCPYKNIKVILRRGQIYLVKTDNLQF